MNDWTLYAILITSLAIAWFAIWNHYSIILAAKNIKPSRWRGDDVTFLGIAAITFLIFSIIFFMH